MCKHNNAKSTTELLPLVRWVHNVMFEHKCCERMIISFNKLNKSCLREVIARADINILQELHNVITVVNSKIYIILKMNLRVESNVLIHIENRA